MELPAKWLTLLLVSACTLLVYGQDNTRTRIPDNLLECYRNQSIRHPENRLPMNMRTFIDIVRKVERYQGGSVDMAQLTTSILHRFRHDGIEKTEDVIESDGVLPFSVTGIPFFKHRLVLKYLVPSNNYEFPNESLSQTELCTLHFMLSHTIDATYRGDESTVCGKLQNYESSHRIPREARFRRQVEESEAAANGQSSNPGEEPEEPVGDTGKAEGTSEQVQDTAQEGDKLISTQKDQAEVLNSSVTDNKTKNANFLHGDDLPLNHPEERAKSIQDPRVTVTVTESDCPLEIGAVYTKWGTVSLGAVLAGLAAGLYPQEVQLSSLVTEVLKLPNELASTKIDNKFAATLVGDLAEAALHQGPKKGGNIKIGLKGGWNSTVIPRWYLNTEKDGREMTDAEIRGGLDGLVLATHIAQWKQKVSGSGLKLSQLLTMYYSEEGVFEQQYRSCQRKDLYSEVAPNDILAEQTYRFTMALDVHALSSASLEYTKIKSFAENAVKSLGSYVPTMDEKPCARQTTPPSPRETNFESLSLHTNVTVIIDRNWPFSDIQAFLYQLADELELWEYGSRLTVLDGKQAAAFIADAMYATDIAANFTWYEYYTHEGGMDIPRLLERELQLRMESILQAEAQDRLAGGRSTVILFVPQTPVNLNDNDLTIAREKIKYFREFLPDVKFLYLVPGSTDNYKELVENPSTDIISFTSLTANDDKTNSVNDVIKRIKEVPLRLFNPTCGANWVSSDYGTADFLHSVKKFGVKYHRLHPNYFYSAASAQITVLSTNSENLEVCYSRKNEYPHNALSDVTCKNTLEGNVEFKLENACEDEEFISQCPPLYIAVRSTSDVQKATCTNVCLVPTNIEYKIRNQGLGCTAGVSHLLSNPQLILLTAALILLVRSLNGGS